MKKRNWIDVDLEGLRQMVKRRGASFILTELWQNAIDENVSMVDISFNRLPDHPSQAELVVSDDSPDGFRNLADAYTLFAQSYKKNDPTKRGRFNAGEKFVLAACETAEIITTTGHVVFDRKGRTIKRDRSEKGSTFRGILKLNAEEYEEICNAALGLIPPGNVKTFFNGEELEYRSPIAIIEVTLPTEIADAEGCLRPTSRKTTIEVYEPLRDETPSLYEMGIAVVDTGDKWHYNIMQKVPLTLDRSNVPPSFLREVRVAVFNALYARVTSEDSNADWCNMAANSPKCNKEAINFYLNLRFGEKRVSFDPTDPEANKIAVSEGYTVVHGSMMGGGAWVNAKAANAIAPAGKVTPSDLIHFSADGKKLNYVAEEDWTAGMARIVEYAHVLAKRLLGTDIRIDICSDITLRHGAFWGDKHLTFNVGCLGRKWFDTEASEPVNDLLIHEFGHYFCADHLDAAYYNALSQLGAKLVSLVLADPTIVTRYFKS